MKPRLFHPASKFPTPNIKLLVRTADGSTHEVTRPNYAQSFKVDPNYRRLSDNAHITEVTEWSIL